MNFKNLFTKGQEGAVDGVPPQGYAPHEEFESKRTTKLGMIMVIVMVITGLWQGQNVLNSINATITPPERLTSCFFTLVNESGLPIKIDGDFYAPYSQYSYQNIYNTYNDSYGPNDSCAYGEIEKTYGIGALYDTISPLIKERADLQKERSELENSLWKEKQRSSSTQDSYNTSLFESIADTSGQVYSLDSLSEKLRLEEAAKVDYQASLDAKDKEIELVSSEIKTLIFNQRSSLDGVAKDFNARVKWLEFKRFLVTAILLFPLAYFALRRYFRAKNERSEFAIIWGGAALIVTLLSSQVFFVFAYKILPRGFLEAVFNFFIVLLSQFKILLVLFQWSAFILIPLFFGYIVYKIQKKYYNKEAVVMRALKDGKCPQCSMKIKDHMIHCPICSCNLRKVCATCQHSSISYAHYCENCGAGFVPNEVKS